MILKIAFGILAVFVDFEVENCFLTLNSDDIKIKMVSLILFRLHEF